MVGASPCKSINIKYCYYYAVWSAIRYVRFIRYCDWCDSPSILAS